MYDKQSPPPPGPGMTLGTIYYVIFRHKRKIALIILAGLILSVGLYLKWPRIYQSDAKLLVRYVLDTRSPVGEPDAAIKSPDQRGENVINSELEILSSQDLALQVADAIGAQAILAKYGGGNNRYDAAALIHKNLEATARRNSSVVYLAFQHPDPEIAQSVLKQVIESYLKKHAEIHNVGAFDDFLLQETDQLRARLQRTDLALMTAKTNAGIISAQDVRKAYGDELSRIQREIREAEAELAERRAVVGSATGLQTNNALAGATQSVTSATLPAPAEKVREYKQLCGLLDSLSMREQELRIFLTPGNSIVKEIQAQIATNELLKIRLEEQYPTLAVSALVVTRGAGATAGPAGQTDRGTELGRIAALESKVSTLKAQRDEVQKEILSLSEAEISITELERRRELEEANYKNYARALEQARIDERLGAGRVSNISTIQSPSPARNADSKMVKVIAAVLFGSMTCALALAFFIEFYLDQSLKRPADIENKIGLPLFVSIPLFAGNGTGRLLKSGGSTPLLPQSTGEGKRAADSARTPDEASRPVPAVPVSRPAGVAGPNHLLRPFSDALRDRLITFFEVKNLTHKPKLVAVTSCQEGAGVSTVAAELAASLSETGDGNVLLVNMQDPGSAHQFYRGDLACGLDEALEADKRDQALVQEKLYVVSGSNREQLPRALPKRFNHLVPKLRASDYDYIIFDMPPVNQISMTPRLARFMDMVLLVVESEHNDRELVKRASGMLSETQTNVGLVLNKYRTYVPRRLQEEF